MVRILAVVVTASCVFTVTTPANAQLFTPLGDLPGGLFDSIAWDVSADGMTVVGTSQSMLGLEAFRWTRGTEMQGLGYLEGSEWSSARAVSSNGSVIVGTSGGDGQAYRWMMDADGTATMSGLGPSLGGSSSRAYGVSGDGSVVVGSSSAGTGGRAFRWEDDQVTDLGVLAAHEFSSADNISSDGTVVVGASFTSDGLDTEAFRWTSDGMVGLGDLDGGVAYSLSTGRAVSADGSVVVGSSESASGIEAFRWTHGTGMMGLGDLPGGEFDSLAFDVSADGSIVVGIGSSSSGDEAFIWDSINGMRSLKSVLSDLGVHLTDWQLTWATGISADGRMIVGKGINPTDHTEAWLARIPEPSTLALAFTGVGLCVLCRRLRR